MAAFFEGRAGAGFESTSDETVRPERRRSRGDGGATPGWEPSRRPGVGNFHEIVDGNLVREVAHIGEPAELAAQVFVEDDAKRVDGRQGGVQLGVEALERAGLHPDDSERSSSRGG
jgi:hypothetical protein